MRRASIFDRNPRKTLLVVVLVCTLAIDLAAGLLLIPNDHRNFRRADPYYHHGLIPNRSGVSKWRKGAEYRVYTNSLGFVDAQIRDVSLLPDRKRILFIGDSFTEGLGVPYEQTFVGVLSQSVDRDRMEILNAAALSYCPKLYYLKIKYLLDHVGLRFDELYVFLDISDIQDEVLYETFESTTPSFAARSLSGIQSQLKGTSYIYFSVDRLISNKQKEARRKKYSTEFHPPWLDYFWLEDQDAAAWDIPGFALVRERWSFDPLVFHTLSTQKGITLAQDHMQHLIDLCKQRKIDVTIAVYPWMAQVKARDPADAQPQIWQKFTQKNGVRFIDLFPDFINEKSPGEIDEAYFIPGDNHWNEEGHRVVAEKVLAHLKQSHPDAILQQGSAAN